MELFGVNSSSFDDILLTGDIIQCKPCENNVNMHCIKSLCPCKILIIFENSTKRQRREQNKTEFKMRICKEKLYKISI